MNYTLHQLRIFSTVLKNRSITLTAEELNLTQPAVSIQLKKFQEQFKIPLTETRGRGIHITQFGEEIGKVCKSILQEAEQLKQTSDNYLGLITGSLHFSVVSTAKYVIPYFLSDFKSAYPDIEIKINVTNKETVLKSLTNNEDDFCMVSILPDMPNTESLSLIENKLVLVGRQDLADQVKSPQDLARLPMIYREQGSATRLTMEKYLKIHGIQASNKMELVSNEAVKQAVKAGLGLSIMPMMGLKHELAQEEIQIIQMPGLPLVTDWQLVYNKKNTYSPAANAFIQHMNQNKKEIANKYF